MNNSESRSTSFLVCQLAQQIRNELNNAFQNNGVDVTSEQWSVLKCLWQTEGISQSEIAARVLKDKASITRILDLMEKNNLIQRCPDPEDRRSYQIMLTLEGKRLEDRLRPLAQAANARVFQNLDDEERQELRRLLLKSTNAMK